MSNNDKALSIDYDCQDKDYFINEIERIYNNQSSVTLRLDYELKRKFEEICKNFGMDASTAINIFLRTVVREKRIPFEIRSGELEEYPKFNVNKTIEKEV